MYQRILVTGGAGFIGRHVVSRLLEQGTAVTVFDSLVDQVHGGDTPEHLKMPGVQFIQADMGDRERLARALSDVDGVIHLAAEVGVGQSMYEISKYVGANTQGTADLLDVIVNKKLDNIGKFVVASSMSIYGEGGYSCLAHGVRNVGSRTARQLAARQWNPVCDLCGEVLQPVATSEAKRLDPGSVYAISKMDQELLSLNVLGAYGIEATAVRYFNTYGPGQALSNPYTGVAAIFAGRLLNGNSPLVNEDGHQLRDFVHVDDVAAGTVAAFTTEGVGGRAYNIGSGTPISILNLANLLSERMGIEVAPTVTNQYRVGDIRHCYADIARAEEEIGYRPQYDIFHSGLDALVKWASEQDPIDNVAAAARQLELRGLLK